MGVRVSPSAPQYMKIKFLGTSAGWPLPRLGCKCNICASKNSKDRRTRSQLLVNDSILLEVAKSEGIAVLATDDRRLTKAAIAEGLTVENPITAEIRADMVAWEQDHLPAKGTLRILASVHSWLKKQDTIVADLFLESTKYLKKVP